MYGADQSKSRPYHSSACQPGTHQGCCRLTEHVVQSFLCYDTVFFTHLYRSLSFPILFILLVFGRLYIMEIIEAARMVWFGHDG